MDFPQKSFKVFHDSLSYHVFSLYSIVHDTCVSLSWCQHYGRGEAHVSCHESLFVIILNLVLLRRFHCPKCDLKWCLQTDANKWKFLRSRLKDFHWIKIRDHCVRHQHGSSRARPPLELETVLFEPSKHMTSLDIHLYRRTEDTSYHHTSLLFWRIRMAGSHVRKVTT